jgi:hypothetical protein
VRATASAEFLRLTRSTDSGQAQPAATTNPPIYRKRLMMHGAVGKHSECQPREQQVAKLLTVICAMRTLRV